MGEQQKTTAVTVKPVVPAVPEIPDTTEIRKRMAVVANIDKSITVDSDATRKSAAELMGRIRTRRNEVREKFAPIIEGAQETKRAAERTRKAAQDLWEEIDKPGKLAEDAIKRKIGGYDDQQRALAAEAAHKQLLAEREKARALAVAKAAEERAAVEKERAAKAVVEAKRLRMEGKAKAARDMAAKAQRAEAIARENEEAAKAARDDAAGMPIQMGSLPPPTKARGASTRQVVKWKLIDFAAVPDECKILDEALLNRLVRTQGMKLEGTIEGIAVYEETEVRAQAV
jgi:hypothetical protein